MAKFSQRLVDYRAKHRLDRGQLGEKLGVTGRYLGALERGEKEVEDNSTISQLLAMYEAMDRPAAPPLRDSTMVYVDEFASDPRAAIKQVMRDRNLKYTDLAKLTKYNAGVLEAVLGGNGGGSEPMIKAIAKALHMDAEQLMAGSDQAIVREGLVGTHGATPDILLPPGVKSKFVPLISMAQAGTMGEQAFTDGNYTHEGVVAFDIKDPRAFSVRIVGDSMEDEFHPGDYIIVSPSTPPRNGDCVLARLSDKEGGGVMFKLYTAKDAGKRVILSSYNHNIHPPIEIPREHLLWIYPMVGMTRKYGSNHS